MPTIGIFESGLDEAFWEKGRSDKEVAAEILIGGSARDEGDSFIYFRAEASATLGIPEMSKFAEK
jgi:hypothetical protein